MESTKTYPEDVLSNLLPDLISLQSLDGLPGGDHGPDMLEQVSCLIPTGGLERFCLFSGMTSSTSESTAFFLPLRLGARVT